jgi:hypothetical protein
MEKTRLRVDFNGLFGDILCLSHGDSCLDESAAVVVLHSGMVVTAFDEDVNDAGEPDDLVASGTVERSPHWLECEGLKWVLRIDANGVRNQSQTAD